MFLCNFYKVHDCCFYNVIRVPQSTMPMKWANGGGQEKTSFNEGYPVLSG